MNSANYFISGANVEYGATILVPAAAPSPAAPSGQPVPKSGGEGFIAMLVIMGVLLYLMVVVSGRQRKKQEKERETFLSSLKKGDDVETGGGIMGRIVNIDDESVTLTVDQRKDIRIRFRKDMVRRANKSDEKKD